MGDVPAVLSKTRTLRGLQCRKLLWWTAREPAAPELAIDPLVQARLDQGRAVGAAARAHVPGGVLIDLPHDAYDARLSATRDALARGAPVVYEAAFRADGVFVAVDILERQGERFCLTEVKSSTGVREAYLLDVAVQAHVVRRCGLDVGRLEVMHLNRACAFPDLRNLFVRADVTALVEPLLPGLPGHIASLAAALSGPLPDVAVGAHCLRPYPCPFAARCWPALPPHHVSTLYAMRDRSLELDEQGYHTIFDLPEDLALGPAADRQRRAVQTGRLVVDPGLADALAAIEPPVAFLDFETVGLAIPVWNGCHPYDQVPVQFSCHVDDGAGHLAHHAWLADGPGDPRPALAERLVEACAGARTVVAYNAKFERECIGVLARAAPALAAPLEAIAERFVDLLPIVRNHVYHPDFGGSFSLKRVLPALVPGARYEDLVIAGGRAASVELARLLLRGEEMDPEERQAVRRALFEYCGLDTRGLVDLLAYLRRLAEAG